MVMRRFVVGGLLIELALLIIGLTWIAPLARSGEDGAARATAPASERYRIEGEGTGNVVEVKLVATETTQTLADGVDYQVWTFNGTAPGPVIRVKVGDTVRFTLTNASHLNLSHSIDFHAAQTPWDKNYQPVLPGQTFTFDWVARFPGVFMYHCGVPPVLHHIANGMYGAIIVEPEDLEPAREYVLVSSEFYVSDRPEHGVYVGDVEKMNAAEPTYVVFNGGFNRYLDAPLEARPNELIRLWVMNAGPTLTNAFHVIGALFDHVYPDGNPTNRLNGIQTYNVPPGGGAMFELRIPDEGLYPFVTHSFAYTGLGAVGVIKVSADVPAAPASYPMMGDPFSAGVQPARAPEVVSASPSEGGAGQAGEGSASHGGGSAHGGGAATVSLEAAITGFRPKELEVPEGPVTVRITNLDAFPHDFTIDELGVKVALGANETVEATFDAKPGIYTFYCSIPGHREAGMEGTLTVLPGSGH
jgi:nitrite reductase (NO-forming)